MTTMRRGSKTLSSSQWKKLKAAQALAAATTPEDPPASQRTLDRVTKERDELRKNLDAAHKDNEAVKSKLRNVIEKIFSTVNRGQIYSPVSPKENDAADVPEEDIAAMLNNLCPIEKNESLEARIEELETRITLVDGELGKLLRLKHNTETELYKLVSCLDLDRMRDTIRYLWLQSCATNIFSKESQENEESECVDQKNINPSNGHQNTIPESVRINLQPVTISVPPRKLPAETHIKDMQPDLRRLVIQEISLYKGNGADWRLFAQRVGIPEDLVTQWQQMKVAQPMQNVLGVWAASQGATVRMLHRHLVSPQMRCVVLGKRISDIYKVD